MSKDIQPGDLTVDMVVHRLGVTSRTLHYYEEVGLIHPVRRTSGGHRVYDEATVARIEQIIRLKETLGYSLQEIKQILNIEAVFDSYREELDADLGQAGRMGIYEDAEHRLEELVDRINGKIERLSVMRDGYVERLQRTRLHLANERRHFEQLETQE